MKQNLIASALLSSILAAGMFALALPASAQQMGGPGMKGNSMPGPGAQQMSGLQHDMSTQMMGMAGQMGNGNLSAAQQKLMSERMRTMGTMMGDMSGMMGQGMMMDANTQNRMNQMRTQMDGMMHGGGSPMTK